MNTDDAAQDRAAGLASQSEDVQQSQGVDQRSRVRVKLARRRLDQSPHVGGEWVAEQPAGEDRARKAELRRWMRAFDDSVRNGVPFKTPAPRRSRNPEPWTRRVFRHRPTKERLAWVLVGRQWALDWRGSRVPVSNWIQIGTADGSRWIVESPHGNSIPYPRRAYPPLKKTLWDTVRNIEEGAVRPELASDKPATMSALQIVSALRQAVDRGGAADQKLIKSLERLSRSYLRGLWFDGDPQVSDSARRREGLNPVHDRPAGVEALAERWRQHLIPNASADWDTFETARVFMHDLRQSTHYAAFAAELPQLGDAGPAAIERLATAYAAALDVLIAKRREKLCERCAPGRGALGTDGQTYFAEPMPGNAAWGCENSNRCLREMRALHDDIDEQAKHLVRQTAIILGMSADKARGLFDFHRAAQERSDGKRPKRGKIRTTLRG